MDNSLITSIFEEFIIEAEDGIKYGNINIKFHTLEKYTINSSYNDCIPVLIIKNKKELINKLKQYVELVLNVKKLEVNKVNIKKIISLLMTNACYEDFSNPTRFIDNHISFYLNSDFMDSDKKINNITTKRITQSIIKTTPYAFKAYIEENNNKYYLPNIEYGISENTCYIYSLEQVTKNEVNDLSKKIESKCDTELLILSLLLKELFSFGVSRIKVVSYLPMRDRENNAQKLLDDFSLLNYQFNNINVLSYPFEQDEYMNIGINEFNLDNNNFSKLLFDSSELCVKKTI